MDEAQRHALCILSVAFDEMAVLTESVKQMTADDPHMPNATVDLDGALRRVWQMHQAYIDRFGISASTEDSRVPPLRFKPFIQ